MRTTMSAGITLALLWAAPVVPQDISNDVLTVEGWLDFERVADPQISPDGSTIVYTRQSVDKMRDRWQSALWVMDADGSRHRFLTEGRGARWSPDGTRIAFLRSSDPGGSQIFVRWMDAEGAVTQVTKVMESPSEVTWSADGTAIAFTMLVAPERPTADLWRIALPKPAGAEWTPDPRIIERIGYRQDRVGYLDEGFEQIFVVPADGGTPRQVSRGDWNHQGIAWTPDGRSILFHSLRVPDAVYQWQESEIYAVDVATGDVRQLTSRAGPDRGPVISPDGRLVAYVGHDATDWDYVEQVLYVMAIDGSNPRALTTDLDRTPRSLTWDRDGRGVYFVAQSEGAQNVYYAPLQGSVRTVTEGAQLIDLSNASRAGLAVGIRTAPHDPDDIVTFSLQRPADMRRVTAVNDDVLAGKRLGEVEEVWYPSFDGEMIQGWIIRPPDFDPSVQYPMMLVIHGGPHSMYTVGFNYAWQEHAANGYVVLYTNPRGSSGYGSVFGNAIQYNYPGDDFHDLMAGVDSLIGRGYVDEQNMFVYGCSGGGVLTAWTVGHTDRFAAAASLCPVIDWVSFVGTTDGNFLRWYADFQQFPWEDPTEHLRRSPLMYVDNVKTPTLLMTGVDDLRTPIAQTEEFYQALKAVKVPTAMIRMNREWHGTSSQPSNFIRTQLYLRKWFERWGSIRSKAGLTED